MATHRANGEYDSGDDWKDGHFYSEDDNDTKNEEEDTSIGEEIESDENTTDDVEEEEPNGTDNEIEEEVAINNSRPEAWVTEDGKMFSSGNTKLHQRIKSSPITISQRRYTDSTKGSSSRKSNHDQEEDEEILQIEVLSPIDSQYYSKLKLRPISPYEMAVVDPSLLEFMQKKAKKEPRLRPSHFSPRKVIAEKIAAAKLQWKKEKMNNLDVLQQKVLELSEENRLLNRLVKRQGSTLDRLSSNSGELPSLIYAHTEELRVLRQRMKQAHEINRQLEDKLRLRETEILKLRDATRNLSLNKSSSNSTGSSRRTSRASDSASMELEELKLLLEEKEHEIAGLRHNLFIIKKNARQQLNNELAKHKASQKLIEDSEKTIHDLKALIKEKDKVIHHSHIYAHRRYPSRLNSKSSRMINGRNLSSSASMMSLATVLSEDQFFGAEPDDDTPSLKHCSDSDLDMEFNIESSSTAEAKQAEEPQSGQDNEVRQPPIEPLPKSPAESKDDYEGFYNDDEGTTTMAKSPPKSYNDDVRETTSEEHKNEELPTSPLLAEKNDEMSFKDHANNVEADRGSFLAAKKFFEEKGTVITPKDYRKQSKNVIEMTGPEKVELWMPKPSPRTNCASETGSAATGTLEKPLEDTKKLGLLASLNALDAEAREIKGSSSQYEPSFVANGESPMRHRRESDTFNLAFDAPGNNPFNNSSFKSLDSSANSVKSVISVNSDKKAKLMKELFN